MYYINMYISWRMYFVTSLSYVLQQPPTGQTKGRYCKQECLSHCSPAMLITPFKMAKGFHICICHLIVKKHVFHYMRNSFWCSLFYNNKSYNFLSALLQKHIQAEYKMICQWIEIVRLPSWGSSVKHLVNGP